MIHQFVAPGYLRQIYYDIFYAKREIYMKFDQKTPVLLPVTGKAAEGFKRLLEKPSNPKVPTEEQIQEIFKHAHEVAMKNLENETNKTKKVK